MSLGPTSNEIMPDAGAFPITPPNQPYPTIIQPIFDGTGIRTAPHTMRPETDEERQSVESIGYSRFAPYTALFASTVYNPDALIQSKGWDNINGMKTLAAYSAPLNLKRYGVLYLEPEIRSAIQDSKNTAEYDKAAEIRDFVEYAVNNIGNPSKGTTQSFRSLLWNLTNMFHSGFHVSTFTWKYIETGKYKGYWGILSYTPRIEKEVGFWVDPFDLSLEAISIWNLYSGRIDVPLDRIVYGVYNPQDGLPFGFGDARIAYKHTLFLGETFRYWMIAVERGAVPFLKAKTKNGATEYQASLLALLDTVRQGGNLVHNQFDEIEALQLMHPQAIEIYTKTVEFNKAEIAEIILGQTLTTQKGNSGSYGQYKAHENTQEFVFTNAKKSTSDAIYNFFRLLVKYNFGEEYTHLTPTLYLGDLNINMRQQIANMLQVYSTYGMFTEKDDDAMRKQLGLPMRNEEFVAPQSMQNVPLAGKDNNNASD